MRTRIRKPTRDKQINIRATDKERSMIDYAANLMSKNRTDFSIEHILYEAQNIILDQRIFALDDTRYQLFIEQLEAPVKNIKGRQRLMDVKSEWE